MKLPENVMDEESSGAFFKECLAKEFQIGVQLDHANIVRVHSIENDPVLGRCIVMDYIQGMQLNEWLATKPSKKLRKQVMDQIFSAISYCHSKQICHYDLKPSNILITENGQSVKIIDFGLADQDSYAILKHAAGTRDGHPTLRNVGFGTKGLLQGALPLETRGGIGSSDGGSDLSWEKL